MKKTTVRNKLSSFVISSVIMLGISNLGALPISVYTSGHGDIGVEFDGVDFKPHWHMHGGAMVDEIALPNDEEYDPGALLARVAATRLSPNGLASTIGAADGTEIYVMGSSSYQPNLGLSAAELNPANWIGDITLSLSGWTVPSGGVFALYTTNLAGTAVADSIFSTFNAGQTVFDNTLPITPGDHAHFEWGFTNKGLYELELTWVGEHITSGTITATDSFSMQVVPEPASAGIFMLVAAATFALLRRRKG